MSAAAIPARIARDDRRRTMITPEGIALPLTLASRGARAGALFLDLMFVGIAIVATTLMLVAIAGGTAAFVSQAGPGGAGGRAFEFLIVVWFAAMFLLRNAWFLYFEPSQKVTAKPALEAKPEVAQAAARVEPPPPPRPEVAEAKPAPTPAPAATVAPAAAPPAVAVAAPSRPLSKDEIKELQGKLGAAGFTVGPIDGVVGPQTQAALRRYAQSRSLAKPPEPTQETLLRLRSETQATQ